MNAAYCTLYSCLEPGLKEDGRHVDWQSKPLTASQVLELSSIKLTETAPLLIDCLLLRKVHYINVSVWDVCVCDESQWEERTEPWTDKRVSSHLWSTSDRWSELSSWLRHEKTGFSPRQRPWTKFWPSFKRFWLPVNVTPVFFQPWLWLWCHM